jgi:hypothetical protein
MIWGQRAGLALHGLVGAVMILAGTAKVLGLLPVEAVEKLGLGPQIRLIGVGELASGLLMILPRTTRIGILLTSSFWGGAICLHMSRSEEYVGAAVLLLLSWAGAYLRDQGFPGGSGAAASQQSEGEQGRPGRTGRPLVRNPTGS